jgi:hypothetical protein
VMATVSERGAGFRSRLEATWEQRNEINGPSVKPGKSASLSVNKLALDSEWLWPTAAGRRPIRLKHP